MRSILLTLFATLLSPLLAGKEEPAGVRAEKMLEKILSLYSEPRYGLLTETYPPAKSTVDYLAQEGGEREVAYLWPYSGVFSAAITLYEASGEAKWLKQAEDLFHRGLVQYWDTTRTPHCYQSYPVVFGHEDRYYDDNIWIALDLCRLYTATRKEEYLRRAEQLHEFIFSGWSETLGGGIFWCEQKRDTKNTCSNAPAAVLCMKLYGITGMKSYLEQAIRVYKWTKEQLRDPADNLYRDNLSLDGNLDRRKFTYNSGEMIEAGVLLYRATADKSYLKDARRTAQSAFELLRREENGVKLYKDMVWFNAILLRGYNELLAVDHNRKYVDDMAYQAEYLWKSRRDTNGLIDDAKKPGEPKWLLINAALVEILAETAKEE